MIDGLLLAPGAGSNADHSSLLTLEAAILAVRPDIAVRRFDFGYRLAGRRFPDRAPHLLEEVRDQLAQLHDETGATSIVVGGRSMGGRICSMVAAQQHAHIAGVLAICYPLHPPGKPERLRVEHFPALAVPTCFISGDRDEFGTPDEFDTWIPNISGPVTRHLLLGKRHELKGCDDDIAAMSTEWLTGLG